MEHQGNVWKGALLVAGTMVGGGMLALPVATSLAGFFPSLVLYFICWLFMTSTGLLFLEVCQWLHKEANIVSMAKQTLGPWAKWAAWGLYIFLFYCLSVAYIVASGQLIAQAFQSQLEPWQGALLFVLIFAPPVCIGARIVGKLNAWLMGGLLASYLTFVLLGYSHVNFSLLLEYDWNQTLYALPIAFTAFAYHGIIPTLHTYMGHEASRTRSAILIGSVLPLIGYIVWQLLILGIVPVHVPGGLADALHLGQTAVQPLKEFINNPWIYVVGQCFAFFALVTSFLGVTLGLIDFFADAWGIKKERNKKAYLSLLVFLPPLFIAFSYPHVFLKALEYAGGIGSALLLGLLPILMVWNGRYFHRRKAEIPFPGGKPVLFSLALFVVLELIFEVLHILK